LFQNPVGSGTASFEIKKSYKRLHPKQLPETNEAIREIISNPEIGEKKHGDLSWLSKKNFS
jgi:hypothetical protein